MLSLLVDVEDWLNELDEAAAAIERRLVPIERQQKKFTSIEQVVEQLRTRADSRDNVINETIQCLDRQGTDNEETTSNVLDSLGRVLQRQCQLETLVESLNLQLKATEDFEARLALVEETLRLYTGPSDSSSTSPAWSPNNTAIVLVPETPNNKEMQGQVDKKADGGRLIVQHGPVAASP
ncbi:hypothetical protein C0991_012395, partial [Blastosporella zonata]